LCRADRRIQTPGPGVVSYVGTDGSRLFFVGSHPTLGYGIYVSRGTADTTNLITDIEPTLDSEVTGPVEIEDGRVFFEACSADYGNELWCSDGTAAGTVRQTDLAAGEETGFTPNSPLLPQKGGVVFAGTNGITGSEPWFLSDSFAPFLIDGRFRFESSHSAFLRFSESLCSTLTASDFVVTHLSSNTVVPSKAYSVAFTTSGSNKAARTTLSFSPLLSDGRYRVSLAAGAAADARGNLLAATRTTTAPSTSTTS
jgi:ELWxxDGT repeat protein